MTFFPVSVCVEIRGAVSAQNIYEEELCTVISLNVTGVCACAACLSAQLHQNIMCSNKKQIHFF